MWFGFVWFDVYGEMLVISWIDWIGQIGSIGCLNCGNDMLELDGWIAWLLELDAWIAWIGSIARI